MELVKQAVFRNDKKSLSALIKKDISNYKLLYIMLVPIIVYFILFCYWPMYGLVIAFQEYKPRLGISGSEWVGLANFSEFFASNYFVRIVKNTLLLNMYKLVVGFPMPIIFAILLNEVMNTRFKKIVQTSVYLPHFVTTVVLSGLIIQFTNSEGFITQLVNSLSNHNGSLISDSGCFRAIYVISDIWKNFGWNSIIYLAALTGIDPNLYEAAYMDGANKLRQMWHITLPGILPTIIIMLILACGEIMNVGWEKAFLLQSPLTYETSDIISTYVYRKGFEDMDFSYSAAVGVFNSVINFGFLITANALSKKFGESSLW